MGRAAFARMRQGQPNTLYNRPMTGLFRFRRDFMSIVKTKSLDELAEEIKSEHLAVMRDARSAVDHALHCGRLLLEAKSQLPHGEWLPWLRQHCSVRERQASSYIRIAANWDRITRCGGNQQRAADFKGQDDPDLTVRRALTMLASDADEGGSDVGKEAKAEKLAGAVAKLPPLIRRQHEDGTCRLWAGQVETLLNNGEASQVERALRVGQAETTKEAYKLVHGKALKGTKAEPVSMAQAAALEEEAQEPTEISPSQRMEAANKKIESACRAVMAAFKEHLEPLENENAWLRHLGRVGSAKASVQSGLTTVRTGKGAVVCPRCSGDGCKVCLETGWLTKDLAAQL